MNTLSATSYQLKTRLYSALTPLLDDIGFKKRRLGFYTFGGNSDVLGSLGVPTLGYPSLGIISFYASVGVVHESWSAVWAKLMGLREPTYMHATVWEPLEALLPREQRSGRYEINFDEHTPAVLNKFVENVRRYALPFIEEHENFEAAVRALRDGKHATPDDRVTKLPAALIVLGRPQEARSFAQETLAAMEARGAARIPLQGYREFTARVIAESDDLARRFASSGPR